jgi:uncharacterized protein YcbK (DUF882 family)
MTDNQLVASVEAVEDDASEAEGVEQIEKTSKLAPERAAELDTATLDELDEEERAELESEAKTRGPGAGVRVAAHFLLREFHCKDGTPVPAAAVRAVKRLATEVLEPMRAKFGACTVHSGYRTEAYNKRVGGKPGSRHQYHTFPSEPAADVTFPRGNPREWAAEAERLLTGRGGIGTYPGFVHVDIRAARSRWDEKTA